MLDLRSRREIIGPVHPYIGQEAVAVGVCAALHSDDFVVSHYRGHGHAIARGVDLGRLTAELMGRATGLCGGRSAALISDMSINLLASSGIVGAGVPIAAGAAMASQIRRDGTVSVVFHGDGALGAGVVHETFRLASAQRLPIIFVCENNFYQGATRSEHVFPTTVYSSLARAHGLRAVEIDGNDVDEVFEATKLEVDRVRDGAGPVFVDARTYLTRFHLQFDKPSGEIRPGEELARWRALDPLDRVRARLEGRHIDAARLTEVVAGARDLVAAAVEFARNQPWPTDDGTHQPALVAAGDSHE